ncbi:MAG: hypothetical protein ACUVS7_10265 [Bryobacteraceae bacterium]
MNLRQAGMTAAAVVLSLGATAGVARAEGRILRAEIPFDFQAGNHALPAGVYIFEHWMTKPVLVITTPQGRQIAMLTHPAGKVEAPPAPGLVFERDADRYSLAEVWSPGAAHRASLSPAKRRGPVAGSRQRVRIVATLATQ